MLNRYELNIYDKDNNISETLTSDVLRWGDYVDIATEAAKIAGVDGDITEDMLIANFDLVQDAVLRLFPGATVDKLRNADASDMMDTFKQVVSLGQKFGEVSSRKKAGSSKN